jgi:hypothetical protein
MPNAHNYAISIDVNAGENIQGDTSTPMSADFARAFTDSGLTWGFHFPTPDTMHFSLGY